MAAAAPLWSSFSLVVPPLLCRQLLKEDRMSLVAFFHPFGSIGWQTAQPFGHVYLVEEVLDILLRSPIPHQLDGRNICLRVQPRKAMPVASADQPFCLLLSRLGGMYKHPLKDDRAMQSSNLPQWVLIKEHLCIHTMRCFPYRHSSFLCPLFGGPGLLPLTAVVEF